ncbi:MAG: hypothetical protein A2341_24025 [Deltaproteobacteria bacterium RIFOXYB12_FULL_58_9]|nr:MAG: hypothetical protein A2341_24025 [Deltaproteobacteria bacterium RIFOXYB12_FULL_58_9]
MESRKRFCSQAAAKSDAAYSTDDCSTQSTSPAFDVIKDQTIEGSIRGCNAKGYGLRSVAHIGDQPIGHRPL